MFNLNNQNPITKTQIKYTWNNINIDKANFCDETAKMAIMKVKANDGFNYIFIPKTHIKTNMFNDSLRVGIANERDYRVYFSLGKDAQYTTIKGAQLFQALSENK